MKSSDLNKSIEQLENDFWKDEPDAGGIIQDSIKFRKIPIKELSHAQIRFLIGQNIGLDFLLPMAISIVEKDILTETEFYPGDLISAIVACDPTYWPRHPEQKNKLSELISGNLGRIKTQTEKNIHRRLIKQLESFG